MIGQSVTHPSIPRTIGKIVQVHTDWNSDVCWAVFDEQGQPFTIVDEKERFTNA